MCDLCPLFSYFPGGIPLCTDEVCCSGRQTPSPESRHDWALPAFPGSSYGLVFFTTIDMDICCTLKLYNIYIIYIRLSSHVHRPWWSIFSQWKKTCHCSSPGFKSFWRWTMCATTSWVQYETTFTESWAETKRWVWLFTLPVFLHIYSVLSIIQAYFSLFLGCDSCISK